MKKKLRIIKNKLGNIVKLFQNRDADNIKEIYISEILHKKKRLEFSQKINFNYISY